MLRRWRSPRLAASPTKLPKAESLDEQLPHARQLLILAWPAGPARLDSGLTSRRGRLVPEQQSLDLNEGILGYTRYTLRPGPEQLPADVESRRDRPVTPTPRYVRPDRRFLPASRVPGVPDHESRKYGLGGAALRAVNPEDVQSDLFLANLELPSIAAVAVAVRTATAAPPGTRHGCLPAARQPCRDLLFDLIQKLRYAVHVRRRTHLVAGGGTLGCDLLSLCRGFRSFQPKTKPASNDPGEFLKPYA
jgi:hypothetical protein